jgi:23S rRNA pseudouridine2457 synthase
MRYILFYKPYEVLSQFSPSADKKTLAHFFNDLPRDVYPAGRLDYDSEGLILLTSDKALAHQLTDPKYAHQRTYFVQVEGLITPRALQQLSSGVDIRIDGKEHRTRPALVQLITGEPQLPPRFPPIRFRKAVPVSWLSLTLTEGRNRQVRRMTAAVGFPTLRLVRYAIGRVTAAGMQPGDFIEGDKRLVQDLLRNGPVS